MQQLAEHEEGIEGARNQIGPLRESIEQQLQAMKVDHTLPVCSNNVALLAYPHADTFHVQLNQRFRCWFPLWR